MFCKDFLWKGKVNAPLLPSRTTNYYLTALRQSAGAFILSCHIIHSIITYGIIFRGNSSYIIGFKKGYKNHDGPQEKRLMQEFFTEMKILPLRSQYIYSLMQYVVNNTHLFIRNTEVHNIGTRQNINLFPPSISLAKVQKGAYYSGIKIYNHFFFFIFGLWDYRHCGHSWPIVPTSGDNEDDCGEHDGM
jgi:hypothetical protein